MREHISGQYDAELHGVRDRVMEMGGAVEMLLKEAGDALLGLDGDLAESAIARDAEVNRFEVLIDEECNRIIARRQPTASDLRLVMSIVKTIPDLERIGDEGQRIAKMALEMSGMEHPKAPVPELREMIRACRENLRDALDAFARVAVEDAVEVIARDKQIDAAYKTVLARLVPLMEEDASQVRPLLNLIWCARSLERIGDHAKNVCEYVVFLGRGQDVRHLSLEEKRSEAGAD